MQSEKDQPGIETGPAEEVNEVHEVSEVIEEPEHIKNDQDDLKMIEETEGKGQLVDPNTDPPVKEEETIRIEIRWPPWNILNGSGKICLQADQPELIKRHKSGLFLSKGLIDTAEKYRSPIPPGTVFTVVDYDTDINLKYRLDKLRLMKLDPHNKKDAEYISRLDKDGQLDVVRIGDQVHFNYENFIPVALKTDLDVYYVVHHLDILAINKTFPRNRLESVPAK